MEKTKIKNTGLTEAQVQNQVLCYLNIKRIFHWRQNTGAVKTDNRYIRFSEPGISDILGILPDGRFLAIEVKREKGGRVSEAQKQFIQKINDNNGVAFVVSSLQELIDKLEKVL